MWRGAGNKNFCKSKRRTHSLPHPLQNQKRNGDSPLKKPKDMTNPDIQNLLKMPLRKTPVTAQYFSTLRPEIKKREFPTYKPAVLPPHVVANYHFICLLGREVADSLAIFSENRMIPATNIKFIERGMSKDMDYTWKLAQQSGRTEQYAEDFELLVSYFGQLADKNLSEYQKTSVPNLQQALATLLIMEYSFYTAEFVTKANNQKLSIKQMRILIRKRDELKRWFLEKFATVSNLTFDFKRFQEIWEKINRMQYTEAREYFQNKVNQK